MVYNASSQAWIALWFIRIPLSSTRHKQANNNEDDEKLFHNDNFLNWNAKFVNNSISFNWGCVN